MSEDKIETIKLKGGAEVRVNFNNWTTCRSCGVKIWWTLTKNDKPMPINRCEDGEYESHFASCKQANKWRKK